MTDIAGFGLAQAADLDIASQPQDQGAGVDLLASGDVGPAQGRGAAGVPPGGGVLRLPSFQFEADVEGRSRLRSLWAWPLGAAHLHRRPRRQEGEKFLRFYRR